MNKARRRLRSVRFPPNPVVRDAESKSFASTSRRETGRKRPLADALCSIHYDPMDDEKRCCCRELDDFAVVGMGDPNGLDDRVFATLDRVQRHGGTQWWLSISTCHVCGQNWMIAQDERIHDNFYLKRIDQFVLHEIVHRSHWPDDFLRYEQVLRLGRESGRIAQFANPHDPALIDTVSDLRRERRDISAEDIAYVLAIPHKAAAQLLAR